MAGRTGIAIVALSQLSRRNKAEKNKPPTMADLRESGQLEQDADAIMLLYLDNEDMPGGDRLLRVAKNKEGSLGYLRLGFDDKYLGFHFKGGLREIKPAADKPKSKFKDYEDNEPSPFEQIPLDTGGRA